MASIYLGEVTLQDQLAQLSAPPADGTKPFPWAFVAIYLSLLRLAVTVKYGREIKAYKLVKRRK